jgi:membrane protein involved in colicin uptake
MSPGTEAKEVTPHEASPQEKLDAVYAYVQERSRERKSAKPDARTKEGRAAKEKAASEAKETPPKPDPKPADKKPADEKPKERGFWDMFSSPPRKSK